MSSIVRMYDASNNDVYPITHLRAVRDSNGTTLESMIQGVNETTVGYYECNTAGSTQEKTITIDSSVSLSVRISCKVKFAEKNTGANATMNINNTGAKPLFYNGVRAAANNSWYPNEIVDLYFDGTNYQAKSCADTLEYDVSLHQTHEITEVTTTTRTVVYNGDVTSGWENETSVSDSSVNGYTRTETNTGKDNNTTTVDGPTAKYDTASNKTSVVYVTKRTLTHVVNDYTFDEAVNAVPMSYRHGGLKLSFISNNDGSLQNSDNKYVQYRLMANEWSTTVSDWQGVDDEPVEGSDNLVKSGGVSDSINKLKNAGHLYAGIATPTTNPGTPEVPVFYIANGKGTYTNFGGIDVTEDEVVILYWDTAWHKEATGIASNDKLPELEGGVDNLNIQINGGSPSVEVVWERGGITSSNGQDSTSTSTRNIRVNGYIEIKLVKNIVWKNVENTNRIYLYDANKTFVKYVFQFESVTDDAVYLRASITAPEGVVADYDNWQQYVDIVLVAADKSIVGDINSLKSHVEILDSKRYAPTKLVQFSSPNGYYNTSGAIGASASLVFTPNTTDWLNVVAEAEEGDIFVITGVGGTSPKTWAFIDTEDNNKILLASASKEVCQKKIVVAPKKCKLYCNFQMYPFQMYPQVEKAVSGISTTSLDIFTRLRNVSEKPLEIIEPFYMASVIHSWGFIGDSLMSGYTDAKMGSIYEYSWGQRMCKFFGAEGFNFSLGGQTAKGWIEGSTDEDKNARCWEGAKTNLKQAYIIGLGVNDRKDYQDGKISIGSVATDVKDNYNLNSDTFAGNYAGIIQRLRSVRPESPIFLVNMPKKINVGVGYTEINTVIADCAEKFSNVWLIDLWNNGVNYSDKAFESKFVSGSHLNYIGYQYVAMQMAIYINWIVENNIDAFKNIGLIDYL